MFSGLCITEPRIDRCITCHTLEEELGRIAIAKHPAEGEGTGQAESRKVFIRGVQGSPELAKTLELLLGVSKIGAGTFEHLLGPPSRFARVSGDGSMTHDRPFDRGTIEASNPTTRSPPMKPSVEPPVESSTVSLSEASRLLSKPENTIREWIKTEKLHAHRDSRGRWLIRRHDLMAYIATKSSTEGRPGATSNATSKARSHIEGSTEPTAEPSTTRYIRSLEDSLNRERHINDELRQQLRQVEQERTQHMAEMRAMLSKDGSGGKEGVLSRWIRR